MSVSRCDGLKRDRDPLRSSSVGGVGSRNEDGEDEISMTSVSEVNWKAYCTSAACSLWWIE
jgi:hypothetical protein